MSTTKREIFEVNCDFCNDTLYAGKHYIKYSFQTINKHCSWAISSKGKIMCEHCIEKGKRFKEVI